MMLEEGIDEADGLDYASEIINSSRSRTLFLAVSRRAERTSWIWQRRWSTPVPSARTWPWMVETASYLQYL